MCQNGPKWPKMAQNGPKWPKTFFGQKKCLWPRGFSKKDFLCKKVFFVKKPVFYPYRIRNKIPIFFDPIGIKKNRPIFFCKKKFGESYILQKEIFPPKRLLAKTSLFGQKSSFGQKVFFCLKDPFWLKRFFGQRIFLAKNNILPRRIVLAKESFFGLKNRLLR